MYPHGKNGRELIDTLVAEVKRRPAITVLTGAEVVGKSGSFGNYVVDVRVGGPGAGIHPGRSSARSSSPPASTPTSPRSASSATASTAWSRCPSSRSCSTRRPGPLTLPRPAGPQHRLRLLRRQPPARRRERRQRVLLALLLHGRRPRVDPGVGPRPGDPPVPPLPRHADVRQVRDALHRVAQGRLRLPQVPRRRAARGRRRATTAASTVTVRDLLTGGEELAIPVDLVVLVTGMVPRDERGAGRHAQAPARAATASSTRSTPSCARSRPSSTASSSPGPARDRRAPPRAWPPAWPP